MSNKTRYKKLLEPGYIGPVRVKIRLIKTGANPGFYAYEDGNVPQQIIDYYEALAAGGAGLVTVGTGEIDYPIGTIPGWGYRMDEEKYIPSLKKLSDAIHKHDCPAFIQLFHMGPMHPEMVSGHQPISASSLPKNELPKSNFFVAREMTLEDIRRVKGRFVNAAVIARKAGFDGIELNAACNHLVNSFLSRAWNKRHDSYGCDSLENRGRFLVEIIQDIKQAAGMQYPIMVMINSIESGLKNGITLEESKAFAKMIERAGADAIHPRVEFHTNPRDMMKRDSTHFPDMVPYPGEPHDLEAQIDMSRHGQGGWVPAAAEIKKVVSIPVIAVGRLDPDLGEKILSEGKADFISHNRRLMADHDLPTKIMECREEDIAPCTACMICFDRVEHGQTPGCRINTALGKEREYEIKVADKKKKVMIVGGGPSGMEAARVAALRGHDVSLYEMMNRLGGSMLVAATVKGVDKEDLLALIRYLETQVKKLGVRVHLGAAVTPELVDRIKPDVLILAAGGRHDIPDIPGINSSKVITSEKLHHILKFFLKFAGPRLLRWGMKFFIPLMLGKNVVVIGGRLHGCQTAELLVKRGRIVTIADTCKDEQIGDGLLETFMKPWLLLWLDEHGVKIITEIKYEEINKDGLVISMWDGKKQTLKADTIITAMPLKPDTGLINRFKKTAKEVYAIGDTRDPNYIVDAIADGSRIAREI
jgi:2,4-dienoyl-CoA reductase (NADPH2)